MIKLLDTMRGIAVAFVCTLGALCALPAFGQGVELQPGYISGTLQVNGQTVASASIYASWYDPATATSYSGSTSLDGSGSYTLTVNVPAGATPTYNVNATIYLNGYSFYLSPPSQQVAVTAFQTSTLDIIVDPAFVQGTVTSSGEAPTSIYLNAYSNGSASGSGSGSSLTFPVIPCTSSPQCLQVQGTAYFSGGLYIGLPTQYGSAGPGQTATFSWTVTPPTDKGAIAGNITVNGASVSQHNLSVYGPSSGYASLNQNGSYQIAGLFAGSYNGYAYSHFNNYSSWLQHPYSSFSPSLPVAVAGGATTTLDVTSNAAFLQGTVKLTGTKTLAQAQSAQVYANGQYQSTSYGGGGGATANMQTGAYSMVLTEGAWTASSLYVSFYDGNPSSYLNSSLNLYDYQAANSPFSLSAGDTVTRDFTYGTGTVTVNYTVLGGGTLSNPYLYGYCTETAGGQTKWSYNVYASGNQQNVNPGSVTFVGVAGNCQLEAYAYVGGSYTKFGNVNVTVVPGSSQEVDIGAPALTVTFPPADYVTSNASITVTGTAVDDIAVASVTVNGQPAALTPAAPAASVSFSAPLALNLGPNTIQTTASDTSGKNASDTRTVYRDENPPTLNWAPADGASFQVASIAIVGSANDDAGIKSITVNGVAASFTPTGNGNEVAFSVPYTLLAGANFIEVVATDISNKFTAQTHRVTYGVDSTAPIITPTVGGTQVNGWYTTDVVVTWSVSDPESTVTSRSGCDATSITTDTAGTTLTCSATSAGGTSSVSVTIRRDTTRPVISGMPPASCSLWPPNHRMVRVATIAASDAGSGLSGSVQISVTSNEGLNARGDGNTAPDWLVGADGSVQLRAERSGKESGRVYTIRATASDAAGNETVTTGTCTVPHDQR